MKPLTSHEITGCWATLLLPLHADESIDYARLEEQIDLLTESGVHGLYSNGTACEFYTQTESEFIKINSLLARKCEEVGLPFQIGASDMSLQRSLVKIRIASREKPGAIQVIVSDWCQVTLDEAIDCMQAMAQAAKGIPLVLYNPPHAKTVFTPRQIGALKTAVPSMQGVKTGAGGLDWYQAIRPYLNSLSVFVPGHRLATGYQNGAHGSYSNIACLHPRAAAVWYELMRTDIEKALFIEQRIALFMESCIMPYIKHGYKGQAVDKAMAAAGGMIPIDSRIRRPYKSLNESDVASIKEQANLLLQDFFTLAK